MKKILLNGKGLSEYHYTEEKEFETDVVNNAKKIFGEKTFYINLKKLLKDKYHKNRTIPDGYLFDYTFASAPRLYLIENELSSHPVREHIADQLIKFYFSYRNDLMSIKDIVIENLLDNKIDVDEISKNAGFRSADDMFINILNKEKMGVIIVIDKITEELKDLKTLFNFDIELLEFKKFTDEHQIIFHYDEFNDTSLVITNKGNNLCSPDTIIVPAEEEGFQQEFLGNNRWYAVSIGINMLDKLKYIAVYQKKPIGEITYYAEIASIDLYKDTGKYIIYFNGEAKKLKRSIPLNPKNPYKAPQSRVYTSIDKIVNADDTTTLDDIY